VATGKPQTKILSSFRSCIRRSKIGLRVLSPTKAPASIELKARVLLNSGFFDLARWI